MLTFSEARKYEDSRESDDIKGSENVNIDVDESIQLLISITDALWVEMHNR